MRKDIICGYIAVSVGDLYYRITYLPDSIIIDIRITDPEFYPLVCLLINRIIFPGVTQEIDDYPAAARYDKSLVPVNKRELGIPVEGTYRYRSSAPILEHQIAVFIFTHYDIVL